MWFFKGPNALSNPLPLSSFHITARYILEFAVDVTWTVTTPGKRSENIYSTWRITVFIGMTRVPFFFLTACAFVHYQLLVKMHFPASVINCTYSTKKYKYEYIFVSPFFFHCFLRVNDLHHNDRIWHCPPSFFSTLPARKQNNNWTDRNWP